MQKSIVGHPVVSPEIRLPEPNRDANVRIEPVDGVSAPTGKKARHRYPKTARCARYPARSRLRAFAHWQAAYCGVRLAQMTGKAGQKPAPTMVQETPK